MSIDSFWVIGGKYKLLPHEDTLTCIGFEKQYVVLQFESGLEYLVNAGKRHIWMYKAIKMEV